MKKNLESNVYNDFINFMKNNYPKYFYWKTWGNKMEKKGRSDYLGITDKGRFLAVEFKRPVNHKKLTQDQINFLKEIYLKNGIASAGTRADLSFTEIKCNICLVFTFGNFFHLFYFMDKREQKDINNKDLK